MSSMAKNSPLKLNTAICTSSTSTMRRVPGVNSVSAATVIQSDMPNTAVLKQPGLQARRLGHATLVPLRLKHQHNIDVGDIGHALHFAGDVGLQEGSHAAAGRGERHLDVDAVAALGQWHDVAFVDEAELDDVDGNLGVVAGGELGPYQFFVDAAVTAERGGVDGLVVAGLAERIGILAVDANQAAFDITGVAAAERLGDGLLLAGGQGHLRAGRDQRRIAIAAHRHYFVTAFSLSVVTVFSRSPSAACIVCHSSVAHLTRAGYSRTPSSTVSLPSAALSASAAAGLVTMSWKRSNSATASATFMPLRRSVINEAEAVEMAQPMPSKRRSTMTSSSTLRYRFKRSPHSGLWPAAKRLAFASLPKLRGWRL